MGVILQETHIEALKTLRRKMSFILIVPFIMFMLLAAGHFSYRLSVMEERESYRLLKDAFDELNAKQRLIILLKNKPLTISQVLDIANVMIEESKTRHVPYYIVLAVIQEESEFDPTAISIKGARGLGQIMPATWNYYVGDIDLQGKSYRHDVALNIMVTVRYLGDLQKQHRDWRKTLSIYWSGKLNLRESRAYVTAVLKRAEQFKSHID